MISKLAEKFFFKKLASKSLGRPYKGSFFSEQQATSGNRGSVFANRDTYESEFKSDRIDDVFLNTLNEKYVFLNLKSLSNKKFNERTLIITLYMISKQLKDGASDAIGKMEVITGIAENNVDKIEKLNTLFSFIYKMNSNNIQLKSSLVKKFAKQASMVAEKKYEFRDNGLMLAMFLHSLKQYKSQIESETLKRLATVVINNASRFGVESLLHIFEFYQSLANEYPDLLKAIIENLEESTFLIKGEIPAKLILLLDGAIKNLNENHSVLKEEMTKFKEVLICEKNSPRSLQEILLSSEN